MFRLLLRLLAAALLGIALAVAAAVWIAYTGDNIVTAAILRLAAIPSVDLWLLTGLAFVGQLLWRLGASVLSSRVDRRSGRTLPDRS